MRTSKEIHAAIEDFKALGRVQERLNYYIQFPLEKMGQKILHWVLEEHPDEE